jgi:hypothetical protein
MRLLWLRRNEYVFKGRFQPPSQVILSMKKTVAEYEEIPQEDSIGPEEVANIPLHWQAPRAGWFKANWDATLHSTLRKTGIGVVVRNEIREVVAALAKVIPLVEDPTTSEAIAAWHVVKLCVDRGFPQVVLEGDSQIVVSALNENVPSWCAYGHKSKVPKYASGGIYIC